MVSALERNLLKIGYQPKYNRSEKSKCLLQIIANQRPRAPPAISALALQGYTVGSASDKEGVLTKKDTFIIKCVAESNPDKYVKILNALKNKLGFVHTQDPSSIRKIARLSRCSGNVDGAIEELCKHGYYVGNKQNGETISVRGVLSSYAGLLDDEDVQIIKKISTAGDHLEKVAEQAWAHYKLSEVLLAKDTVNTIVNHMIPLYVGTGLCGKFVGPPEWVPLAFIVGGIYEATRIIANHRANKLISKLKNILSNN